MSNTRPPLSPPAKEEKPSRYTAIFKTLVFLALSIKFSMLGIGPPLLYVFLISGCAIFFLLAVIDAIAGSGTGGKKP